MLLLLLLWSWWLKISSPCISNHIGHMNSDPQCIMAERYRNENQYHINKWLTFFPCDETTLSNVLASVCTSVQLCAKTEGQRQGSVLDDNQILTRVKQCHGTHAVGYTPEIGTFDLPVFCTYAVRIPERRLLTISNGAYAQWTWGISWPSA
jgi:hypothetical protein